MNLVLSRDNHPLMLIISNNSVEVVYYDNGIRRVRFDNVLVDNVKRIISTLRFDEFINFCEFVEKKKQQKTT